MSFSLSVRDTDYRKSDIKVVELNLKGQNPI